MDENIEHEGIGVTNHDEVDDYDDSADYDDQEVEKYRDDMDGGQDFKEYGTEHEDYDEEHCEQTVTAGDKSGVKTAATPATTRSTPRRAATPSGTPRRMSATATTATTSTATAAGTATGATTTRTTTTCGQQMSGESAACMPGHLAEVWVLTLGDRVCCSTAPTGAFNPRADRVAADCVQCSKCWASTIPRYRESWCRTSDK